MTTRLAALALIVGSITAQQPQPFPPTALPGDVMLYDTQGRAYLWIHAKDGRFELMPGFAPEQVYKLLLQREQACWDIHAAYVNTVSSMIAEKPIPVTIPGVTK
jgi:hypothetical protein